jgi:hypothetical protein
MSSTLNTYGKAITTDKRVWKATTNNVNAVQMRMALFTDTNYSATAIADVMHEPDIGTTDEFSFNLSPMIKPVFDFSFLDLAAATPISLQTYPVAFAFFEVESDGTQILSAGDIDTIHNITPDIFEFNAFSLTTYDCGDTGSASRKFLTSAPSPVDLGVGESFFLTVSQWTLDVSDNSKQELVIEKYDSTGSLTGTVTQTLLRQTITINTVTRYYALNSTHRIGLTASDSYLLCYVRDISGGTVRSEIFRFNQVSRCDKVLRFHWLNEFGGQDSYTFEGAIKKAIGSESETYTKVRPVNPLTSDAGELTFANMYNYEWEVYTANETKTNIDWISKMLRTNKVAVEIDGLYYPIVLNTKALNIYDEMGVVTNLGLKFRFANENMGIQ